MPKTPNHLLSKHVPGPSLANECLHIHLRRTSYCTRTPFSSELFCDGQFFLALRSPGAHGGDGLSSGHYELEPCFLSGYGSEFVLIKLNFVLFL
jgi:hypothetical protein